MLRNFILHINVALFSLESLKHRMSMYGPAFIIYTEEKKLQELMDNFDIATDYAPKPQNSACLLGSEGKPFKK